MCLCGWAMEMYEEIHHNDLKESNAFKCICSHLQEGVSKAGLYSYKLYFNVIGHRPVACGMPKQRTKTRVNQSLTCTHHACISRHIYSRLVNST